MKQIVLVLLISLCIYDFGFAGEWGSTELCVIGWGKGPDQLFMLPEEITDSGFLESAKGPDKAFIDDRENIIISSFQAYQLKGFKNTGELIFDFSISGPGAKSEILRYKPENIYVDSLSHLYIQSNPGTEYVPVVDYNGKIIKKIRPFERAPRGQIHAMNWNPTGTLFFFNRQYGWVTYGDAAFTADYPERFNAADWCFYHIYSKENNTITFDKERPFDAAGHSKKTEVKLRSGAIISAQLLNGGDGYYLYALLTINKRDNFEIWKYDLNYNVIDKLTLTNEEQYVNLRIPPFVRFDGNIYEFLFREDGLQVIRWSKK